jgi:N-terminal domain from the human glycogen debranching enzyme
MTVLLLCYMDIKVQILISKVSKRIIFPLSKEISFQEVSPRKMKAIISLEYGVHRESDLFRLQRGSVLKIQPGLSLLGKRISVFCNYPAKGNTRLYYLYIVIPILFRKLGKEFERNKYQKLQWIGDIGNNKYKFIDNVESNCVINAEQAGNFHLYFSCEENG